MSFSGRTVSLDDTTDNDGSSSVVAQVSSTPVSTPEPSTVEPAGSSNTENNVDTVAISVSVAVGALVVLIVAVTVLVAVKVRSLRCTQRQAHKDAETHDVQDRQG